MAAGLSGAGILVFAPISIAAGITAAVVLFVIIAVLLVLSTPSITVTAETLQVGRATIERRFIGAVTAFRGKEATAERGPRLNGLAYLCIRGWVDPVVRIEITDPSDPHPVLADVHPAAGTTDGGPHHRLTRPGAWHCRATACPARPVSPRSPCRTAARPFRGRSANGGGQGSRTSR